ncbi:ferrous iron transporter B [Anaerotignum faecicola]|nr:ferrous iron transporter B [Anaerotignum faecicola]
MNGKHVIALAGNPNTGKSTIFNALTGLNQHTGNWSGKTVANASGFFSHKGVDFRIVDLPGIYSVLSDTAEERCAKEFIVNEKPDMVLVVADATCIERNLNLCVQVADLTDNVILCLNLMDEADKKGMEIDVDKLSEYLGIPVIPASARNGEGIKEIKDMAVDIALGRKKVKPLKAGISELKFDEACLKTISIAEEAAKTAVIKDKKESLQVMADRIILSKKFGIPVILLVLGIVFWITIVGANYPSSLLMELFAKGEAALKTNLAFLPPWLCGILVDGMFKTSGWVISVMLPPMAVFFPLFTFLEDIGFLPRIAFNLDGLFKKAGAHGKQSLTMMMGFGCNAAGVTACRIIETPREKLMAIITNNFVPCNGRLAQHIKGRQNYSQAHTCFMIT